jgi:hypothetical protein
MKILKAKLDFMEKFCNPPKLQVLVDSLPDTDHMIYKKNSKYGLYFAEKDGFVNFFSYTTAGNGYGGRHFALQVEQEDGSIKEEILKGPWSSRASVMNRFFDTQSMEVSIIDNPEAFERGYTFYAGAITLDFAKEAIDKVQGGAIIKRVESDGEIYYTPTKLGFYKNGDDFIVEYESSLEYAR